MRQGRMNFRKTFSRGLILPVVLAAVMPGATATAAPKTYTYDGTVANVCKIGTSTSYAISISAVGSGSMTTTASLDGTAGTPESKNNTDAIVTKDYPTICNRTTQQTLTLTAPQATKTGGGTLAYTITVKNQLGGGGTTVATVSTEPGTANVVIPAQTSATWSIVLTATNRNNTPAGTYTATVTIQ
jgi:hypothetical protein